jgi:hypothetical protein
MKVFSELSVGVIIGIFFMSSVKEKFKLPPEYLEALGRITSNFTVLELALIVSICQLIPEAQSMLITRLIAADFFNVLLSKFKKVSIYLIDKSDSISVEEKKELINEIKTFCNRLESITVERDKIVHSLWFIDGEGKISRTKYKKNINIDPDIIDREPRTLESMNEFAEQIMEAITLLSNINGKIIKLRPVKFKDQFNE